jgi:hypothetical protein
MQLDYSRQSAGALTLRLLAQLAAERGFEEMARGALRGEGSATGRTARARIPLRARQQSPHRKF